MDHYLLNTYRGCWEQVFKLRCKCGFLTLDCKTLEEAQKLLEEHIKEPGTIYHYPTGIHWDNIGQGYRIECNCGYETGPSQQLEDAGYDFDEHTREKNG